MFDSVEATNNTTTVLNVMAYVAITNYLFAHFMQFVSFMHMLTVAFFFMGDAFWNMVGSMSEICIPVFVLIITRKVDSSPCASGGSRERLARSGLDRATAEHRDEIKAELRQLERALPSPRADAAVAEMKGELDALRAELAAETAARVSVTVCAGTNQCGHGHSSRVGFAPRSRSWRRATSGPATACTR